MSQRAYRKKMIPLQLALQQGWPGYHGGFIPPDPLLRLQSSFDHGGSPNQTHKQGKLMEKEDMRSCSSSSNMHTEHQNYVESRSTEEILDEEGGDMESGGSNVHTDHQDHEERREVEQDRDMEQDGDMEGALQRNEREM